MDQRPTKDLRRGGSGSHRRSHSRRGRGYHHRGRGGHTAVAEDADDLDEGDATGGSDDDGRKGASYRRREVRSNWSRYGDEPSSELEQPADQALQSLSSGGDDFNDVLQRAGTAASHMKLDVDEPGSFADSASAGGGSLPTGSIGRLQRIDLTTVLDSIRRLPIAARLLLDGEAEDYLRSRACRDGIGVDAVRCRLWRDAPTALASEASTRLARPASADSASRSAQPSAAAAAVTTATTGGNGTLATSSRNRSAASFGQSDAAAVARGHPDAIAIPAFSAADKAKPAARGAVTDTNRDVSLQPAPPLLATVPQLVAVPQPAVGTTVPVTTAAAATAAAAARAADCHSTAAAAAASGVAAAGAAQTLPAAAATTATGMAASKLLEDELDELLAL